MAAMPRRPGTVYNTGPLPLLVNGLVVASGHELHVADLDAVELPASASTMLVADEPSPRAEDDATPAKATNARKKAVTDEATGPAANEETSTP